LGCPDCDFRDSGNKQANRGSGRIRHHLVNEYDW
jgi:hypothetical protein